jgi:hypothetical protein
MTKSKCTVFVSWYLDLESPRNSRVYLHGRFRTGKRQERAIKYINICRMVHTDKSKDQRGVEVRLPETMLLLRLFHAGQWWVLD